jgi:prepilin-type N-terminal cleavage/methylation domain-containing protein
MERFRIFRLTQTMRHSPPLRQAGFTLLEMSIVLAIIGLLVATGVTSFNLFLQNQATRLTNANMALIEKTLLDFTVANGRLPCPSSLALPFGNANYGYEAANPGSCLGGTPAANFSATGGAVEGGVPTRALHLPDDLMYDGWGRKMRYAVDSALTATGALTTNKPSPWTSSTGAITVYDGSGGTRSSSASYVLMSHGMDGHGAYSRGGTLVALGSTNASELQNCHCDSSGNTTTYAPSYVQAAFSADPVTKTNRFDDLVDFRDLWQLQTPQLALRRGKAAPSGIWIADTGNNRVQLFSSTQSYQTAGSYAKQFGTSGTGNGKFSAPAGIASDRYGNLYVSDTGNNRVQKLNANGVWQMTIGGGASCTSCASATSCSCSAGSGNGMFSAPQSLAVDSGGNLWVVDKSNSRVQEFSASGSWRMTIGGGPSCTGCASATSCTCTASAASGYFTNPTGIALDAAGTVWVSDTGNNRLEKFTTSGGYAGSVGTYGSGNGNLNAPSGLAVDGNGNVWVMDAGNHRLEEFSAAGAYLNSSGASGTGNGQFGGTGGYPLIDGTNQLFVSDTGNNRVQIFNLSGAYGNKFGSAGSGVGLFSSPAALAAATQ